jgi:hypothetical protein
MTIKRWILFLSVLGLVQVPLARAQEFGSSDVRKEVSERNAEINKLSTEDQLKLRAAQQKAAEDPTVKAAQEKRNTAIKEFRAAVRASMIKADPTIQPIVERIWK